VPDLKRMSRVSFQVFTAHVFPVLVLLEDLCLDFSEEFADSILMVTAVTQLGAEAST